MERIQILIGKLKEQAEKNSSPSQMLVTVQTYAFKKQSNDLIKENRTVKFIV